VCGVVSVILCLLLLTLQSWGWMVSESCLMCTGWIPIGKHQSGTIALKTRVADCGRGSVLLWRHCDLFCTSGSVSDVMFPHNGRNRPESKTTRMFRPVRQVAAPAERQTTSFDWDRQAAAQGAKYAVSDCILLIADICNFRRLSLCLYSNFHLKSSRQS